LEERGCVNDTYIVGRIKRLVVTDGQGIIESLEGFSQYSIEREAVSTLNSITGPVRSTTIRETIYGIKDISKAKDELLKAFNNRLKVISGSKDHPDEVTKNLTACRENYDALLTKLVENQVVYKSLLVETGVKDKNGIPELEIRQGMGGSPSPETLLGKNYARKL